MSELPTPEHEANFSPQKLNGELKLIIDHLPQTTDAVDVSSDTLGRDMISMWHKRERSEYTAKIEQRVTDLVQKAPVTDHFRKYIIEIFTIYAVVGGNMPQDVLESEIFFLDPTHPESGGIFEQTTAERFERTALAKEVYETRSREQRLERLMENLGQPPESANSTYASRWVELNMWREQIEQHYPKSDTV